MKLLATTTALLGATLLLTAPIAAQRGRPTGRIAIPKQADVAPKGIALLVLVENGGVTTNLAQCKVGTERLRLPQIPVARCGTLGLALNPGESVPQLLARAAQLVARHRGCADPRRWKVEMLSFDEWIKLSSDYLLEELSKAIAMLQNTRSQYDQVVVLEDAKFEPKQALAQMQRLTAAGYAIDVHVLAHGGDEAFYGGGNARFDERSFFAPARAIANLRLRSVYQMNCVSGTLMDDWIRLGAKVVNGTYGKKNNYMPQAYFHFSAQWLSGERFGDAIQAAYAESRIYTEPVYRLLGLNDYVADSRQRVLGDATCRHVAARATQPITTLPGKVLKQTTAMLCAGYKAAKKSAEEACRLLIQQGCDLVEIALELQKQYGCSPEQVAKHLKAAGRSAAQVASCLKTAFAQSAAQIAQHLCAAGYTAGQVARELKEQLNCSASAVAKYLRQAGCSVQSVAQALEDQMKCSTQQIAQFLKGAGCSFEQTAQAIWQNGAKNAAAFQELIQAMIASFQQSFAQVVGNLAKLGIKA